MKKQKPAKRKGAKAKVSKLKADNKKILESNKDKKMRPVHKNGNPKLNDSASFQDWNETIAALEAEDLRKQDLNQVVSKKH